MYDDFLSGMNYGVRREPQQVQYTSSQRQVRGKIVPVSKPATYNKTPQIYMINQYNDVAELWANGDAFLRYASGRVDKMRFPSRPYAIRNLSEKGWVLK